MMDNSPPLDRHDAVKKADNLLHTTLLDELLNPGDRFVSQKKAELVDLANFDEFGLLDLSQVCDIVSWPLLHLDL